jgi:hypothetical protein
MPEPVEPPPPTAKQKREWRAEFKRLGREAVRHQLNSGGIPLELRRKREVAMEWLREKERATEWREQWTFWIAVAILVLTIIGIALTLRGY